MNYSLKNIYQVVIKNLVIILAFAVICGGGMAIQAKMHRTTTYTAERSIYFESDYSGNAANEKLMADINLIKTYNQMIESDNVASVARKKLPKKLQHKYSVSDIAGMVSASQVQMSLVSTIHVKADSAKDSTLIVNAVANAAKEELPQMASSISEVRLFSAAKVSEATSKTTPSLKKRALLGVAIGLLIGMLVSFSITTWKKLI